MERDLLRISAAGFSTILLYITPETMASKVLRNACKIPSASWDFASSPAIALVISSQAKDFTLSLPNTMNFFNSRVFKASCFASQAEPNLVFQ